MSNFFTHFRPKYFSKSFQPKVVLIFIFDLVNVIVATFHMVSMLYFYRKTCINIFLLQTAFPRLYSVHCPKNIVVRIKTDGTVCDYSFCVGRML